MKGWERKTESRERPEDRGVGVCVCVCTLGGHEKVQCLSRVELGRPRRPAGAEEEGKDFGEERRAEQRERAAGGRQRESEGQRGRVKAT